MTKQKVPDINSLEPDYKKRIEELENKIATLSSENIQLTNLIDTLPGDIYWKDKEGVWLGLNTRCIESLYRMGFIKDRDKTLVIGKTDFQLFGKKSAVNYRQTDLEVMEKRTELSREEITHLSSGETITLLSTKRPLWDKEGMVAGIVGNTIDISYLKKIETELNVAKDAAEAANQAKTAFLANMRHDIRTPLSGIVGFSDILKSESTEPKIKEYADNLVASSHALLDLLDEVLEAVRVSSGEIPLIKRKFNLTQVFEQIVALYSAKAKEKNLSLSLVLDKALPQFVLGDKIRIHRIALELVGNALNFTDAGHVTINVALAKRTHKNIIMKLTVSDSGIGIPKEKQQEVYVQFNRLSPSYQGIYKGAGLGLYVVKNFIAELDGEIYVESELRKGTSFTCIIPLQESLLDDDTGIEKTERQKREKKLPLPVKPLELSTSVQENFEASKDSPRILVVEDNLIAQSVAKSLLTSLSCHVDVASDGNEALSLTQKKHYDLIFMDIGLGEGIDGYEVCRQIRSRKQQTQRPLIIALSAHEDAENKQLGLAAGMDVVLSKPLTLASASEMLKKIPALTPTDTTQVTLAIKHDLPDTNEELFQLSRFALFDSKEALKQCENMAMLVQLLQIVSKNVPASLERMKEAYANHDYAQIERIAHNIKGSAVYVGTTRMKYACQYVERYWKTGERELFDKLYHQAVHTIEESCKYIADWLSKNHNS